MLFLLGLLYSYHLKLLFTNLTTNESVKGSFNNLPINPYVLIGKGWLFNNLKSKNLIGKLPESLNKKLKISPVRTN